MFWVFGTDVMVTVAKSFDAPIKVVWPKELMTILAEKGLEGLLSAEGLKFTMLGLGDIVIPGIFVALCLRFDYYLAQKKNANLTPKKSYPKPYFYTNFVFYILGLATTVFVMHTFQAAQPALLYLSPACILSALGTAIVKGQLGELLGYSEIEGEGDAKKSNGAQEKVKAAASASAPAPSAKKAAKTTTTTTTKKTATAKAAAPATTAPATKPTMTTTKSKKNEDNDELTDEDEILLRLPVRKAPTGKAGNSNAPFITATIAESGLSSGGEDGHADKEQEDGEGSKSGGKKKKSKGKGKKGESNGNKSVAASGSDNNGDDGFELVTSKKKAKRA